VIRVYDGARRDPCIRPFIVCFAIKDSGLPQVRTARGVVSEERGRADDNDARAPFLSNTAGECVELLWIFMLDRSLALRLRLGPWAASGEDSP